jgi:hypothetical protein
MTSIANISYLLSSCPAAKSHHITPAPAYTSTLTTDEEEHKYYSALKVERQEPKHETSSSSLASDPYPSLTSKGILEFRRLE